MTLLESVLLSYKTTFARHKTTFKTLNVEYRAAYRASDWPCIIILTCMAYASLL